MYNRRDFIWNMLGTLFHSANSFFFMTIVSRINGLADAGILSFGIAIANIIYIIALYGGRNYQVTDINDEISASAYVTFRLFSAPITAFMAAALLLAFSYRTDKYLIILMICLIKCVEAISDVFHGITQKNDRLDIVGKSFFFKNLVALLIFFAIDFIFTNTLYAVIGWMVISLLFLVLYDIPVAIRFVSIHLRPGYQFATIITKCFFTCAFTTASLFVISIPRYFIDFMLNDEAQGIFGIIVMPATIVMILGQFIVNPVLNDLARSYDKKDIRRFIGLIVSLVLIIFCFALVALLLAYLFGIPVLEAVFNIELNSHKIHLVMIIIGASFYTITTILSVALITMRHTAIQLILYSMTGILSAFLSWFLVSSYQLSGGFYSYLLTMGFVFLLYLSAFSLYAVKARTKR